MDTQFTPAHLWFLLYLFVISLATVLIIFLKQKYLPEFKVRSMPYFFIIFLFAPEWICQYVLNISGKSLGQFLILFPLRYFIFSEENMLQKLQRHKFASLVLFLISGSLYTYLYGLENIRNILMDGLYIFYGWMGIITMIGIGCSVLNFHSRLSDYLTHASFTICIIHMPALVVTGFFVLKLPIGVAGQFLLIVLISFATTFLIYEIVKRIPVLWFFLGIVERKL